MFSYQDQFSAATKSNLQAQLDLINTLTAKAFEGVEKIVELNLSATKASLEESAAAAKQLAAAKDPQELLALAAAQAQPGAEKAAAYGRHLAGIVSATQAEFTKAAEAQVAETSRKVGALIDEISKNAPPGSEQAISLLKATLSNANAGYEQLTKSTKQAVETLEANLSNAAKQFTAVAEKTAATTRSKK
ncbi:MULTISPECIES: TIGR01841 family phasin [unclassified Herbaspirillum]|uniref:TIGR01841 family phasin n=1 Tax=unclassified Herbaspirillum TaxID=2624150 RepID=UPI001150FF30|nr:MULTISPECIES: TIGR01841 family phasin [unclassified Herbaspirillum]MBB5393857.1 phasin family protein [Herbaspirillum sp. SJZ102]TQK01289.1 phasin family protein [Herbaspirillum sp. SJZ130]TQK05683.1 phasin family protein [Herbaspirillum sp. SJZ106]TWC63198.1 phasin family protein [Herbaspirillum sp. SJZ099]